MYLYRAPERIDKQEKISQEFSYLTSNDGNRQTMTLKSKLERLMWKVANAVKSLLSGY